MTPEQLFAHLVASEPSRPFVTYYDEATGERTELSVRSLANWVAKTHYLLLDELGLGVGDTAQLLLPAHWISVPIVLGCLSAGLALDDASGDVAFVTAETMAAATVDASDVYVVATERAAAGATTVPAGTNDYVAAVRPQADAWSGVRLLATDADACLTGLTRGEVVETARAAGLPAGTRLLTTRDWDGPQSWLDLLLAPLAVGGSLVYVRNAGDEQVVERRVAQERVTTRR